MRCLRVFINKTVSFVNKQIQEKITISLYTFITYPRKLMEYSIRTCIQHTAHSAAVKYNLGVTFACSIYMPQVFHTQISQMTGKMRSYPIRTSCKSDMSFMKADRFMCVQVLIQRFYWEKRRQMFMHTHRKVIYVCLSASYCIRTAYLYMYCTASSISAKVYILLEN